MKSIIPWSFGDQYLRPFFDDDFLPRFERRSMNFPRLDIEDQGGTLLVTADIPGLEPKDLQVEAEEDYLVLQGKTEEEKEEKKKNYYRKERRGGSFYREVRLPCHIDPNNVEATFKNGMLQIRLSKKSGNEEGRVKVPIK